jgi:geranylgeranyl reductase family protein
VGTDAIVIGAGPAGLFAARELARLGVEVKVFEEHNFIGTPNHCAGILSVEGMKRLKLGASRKFIQHEIKGGRVFSPTGTAISIATNSIKAYVVDRVAFDRHLADLARDEGAEIKIGSRITGIIQKKDCIKGVTTSKEKIECDIVIDAEGATGKLARKLGFPQLRQGVLSGVNIEIKEVDLEPNIVEVWMGEALSPGFFAWVVPLFDGYVRCGLACNHGDPTSKLRVFLKQRFGINSFSEPLRWPLLTSGPVKRTYGNGILLVGDVAGQTKPTTGGGVIMGGLCAIEAANVASAALEVGYYSSIFLRRYEDAWKKKFGKEFSSMLAFRRFFNRLSDRRIDMLFDAVKEAGLEGVLKDLVNDGDMDMQSDVFMKALRTPSLIRALLSVTGRAAISELKGLFNL